MGAGGFGGPAGAFGPPPQMGQAPAAWQAPTDTEQRLYDAKMRGDWQAYFDVLAEVDLFHAMPRALAEAESASGGSGTTWTPYWSPQVGRHCFAFMTEGVLAAPVQDPVLFTTDLGTIARNWNGDPRWVAINPGTPCEAYFPGNPPLWQWHADKAPDTPCCSTGLRTLRVGAPLQGPVAHGLACGALLAVNNGDLWNTLSYHGHGFFIERKRLDKWWGVTSRAKWQEYQEELVTGQMVSRTWEFTLEVRRALSRQYGGTVDPTLWRETTERVMRANASDAGEPPSDSRIAGVKQLIGRITRYEARFRADGILPERGQVRSALAWDYGRAPNMARWGLASGYCDLREAESAVLRASRASKDEYTSWQDFAAGYILGRCLHFDEEEFGHWYTDMLDTYRLLMGSADSPWVSVPWK
ncbi:DUF1266 domain-containing protein [Streptomyces sp. YC537]|uniref:DUF1266 domain-containing protein n=2 Tax=Streptomyces boluensis TaxID=1775135 RepID=A0A964UNP0_9ACTN|nr:DUF1266 domain-containing protein [Streptomyces boluensis]